MCVELSIFPLSHIRSIHSTMPMLIALSINGVLYINVCSLTRCTLSLSLSTLFTFSHFHQKAQVRICKFFITTTHRVNEQASKHEHENYAESEQRGWWQIFLSYKIHFFFSSTISREIFPVKISFAVEMLTRKYVNWVSVIKSEF